MYQIKKRGVVQSFPSRCLEKDIRIFYVGKMGGVKAFDSLRAGIEFRSRGLCTALKLPPPPFQKSLK